ncbi:HIT domain-containing protein [Nakamurella sp. A5-74]|uniref:HIT domain-containing protein n=1 Tax=Nakamurella sp. A5-74 TaxID=3158264 RepID=A0AAU8DNS8_9ACTN
MTAGVDCGLCADASEPLNLHSVLVTELPTSYVRLVRNQSQTGYCVVILEDHVTELHHLEPRELTAFWMEVAVTSRAIAELFSPVKLNHLSMGHRCPHLHCHVYPQYQHNDPFQNVDISAGDTRPTVECLRVRAASIEARIHGLLT